MDYFNAALPKNMLPTGNVIDKLDCIFVTVEATVCQAANPIALATVESFGLKGNEPASKIDSEHDLISRVCELRGRIAHLLGTCQDWEKVDDQSPMLPMVVLVSRPTSREGNIQSRLFLDNHCHPAMAGTGAVCTTAACQIKGSIVNRLLTPSVLESDKLVIQHPKGHLPVIVKVHDGGSSTKFPVFDILGFTRTARYLFDRG
ncbi:hypothetical protein AB5N19_11422 [Seiridium cardinale]